MSRGKKIAIGIVVAVGAPIFIAGMVNGAEQSLHSQSAAHTQPTVVVSGAYHSTAPSTPAVPSSAPASTALAAAMSAPASHPAPAAARKQAAAILRADDAFYQAEYQRGVTVVLDRGQPNSYGPFSTWYQKAVTGEVQPGLDAFKQADALFTADDEPSAISDWQGDNGQLSSDLATLANDGLDVGGPDDANGRPKVLADEKQFAADYATAEQDAANVAAGK